MVARVVQLRTRADQIKAEEAERLRQMMLSFPELPERAAGEILAAIARSTAAQRGWTFVMLSAQDNARVVAWLGANSSRPMLAVQLWTNLFLHLQWETNEIVRTRDELAADVGATPRDVLRIMGELESIGAISRKRTKIAGMQGPGMVRYFMSHQIGTHLTSAARDKAEAAAPPSLGLIEGGQQ